MPELISIIVPLYNRKKIFLNALTSIYAQDYSSLEVIIVDDGSTKFDIEEMELPMHSGFFIKKIRQNHSGPQVARNRGVAESRGGYVLFWDADVIATPTFVTELYNALRSHDTAGYAYCNFFWGFKKMASRHFDPELLKKENYIHMSALIDKRILVPLDERIKKFQDWDLWLTLLEHKIKGVWVDKFLYRVKAGGVMSTWLPRFAYADPCRKLPFIKKIVRGYEDGKKIIQEKHRLI